MQLGWLQFVPTLALLLQLTVLHGGAPSSQARGVHHFVFVPSSNLYHVLHLLHLQCFSAVVGPNGSGKSNVIDAMLFVFGRRAKQVRVLSSICHTLSPL